MGCLRAVDPVAEPEDRGLVEVSDDCQPSVHIAIQGAVAHGQFRLVAGGQQQLPLLVGHSHQQRPADAGLQVLGGDSLRPVRQSGAQTAVERLHQSADRQGVMAQFQALGQGRCVIDGAGGTPGGWHQQGGDVVLPQCSSCDHGDQG